MTAGENADKPAVLFGDQHGAHIVLAHPLGGVEHRGGRRQRQRLLISYQIGHVSHGRHYRENWRPRVDLRQLRGVAGGDVCLCGSGGGSSVAQPTERPVAGNSPRRFLSRRICAFATISAVTGGVRNRKIVISSSWNDGCPCAKRK